MSHTRLCGDCGKARLIANLDSLHERQGDGYLRWLAGLYRYAAKTLDAERNAA